MDGSPRAWRPLRLHALDHRADRAGGRHHHAKRGRRSRGRRPKSLRARPAWQLCLAARVSKYGITLEQAMWHLPLAALNQLIVWDELTSGRTPRWIDSGEQGGRDIDALLADALTARTL